jgi:hypothetical protein
VTVVAEIVGPPGSGKSRLHASLEGDGVRTMGNYLAARRVPAWTASALSLLSVLREARTAGFGRRELTWIVRLEATPRIIDSEAKDAPAVVFDQGPVYALVRLSEAMERPAAMPRTRAWFGSRLHRWAELLDVIVQLDAPDASLLERIRSRPKDHAVERLDEAQARESLARERASYRKIVDALVEGGRCRAVRLDTDALDAATCAERAGREIAAATLGTRR